MGWEKGKGIGRNPSKGYVKAIASTGKSERVFSLTEPIEFVPRHGKLGLGAEPAFEAPGKKEKKKYIRPNQTREPKVIPTIAMSVYPLLR